MDTLAGFEKTGRVTIGPGSDLVEVVDADGLKHTAVVFHPDCRDHPAIHAGLAPILGFLEAPYVTGLSELVGHDVDASAFVYPTGDAWSVYDVVRTWSDMGETPGIRAGLELMYVAGSILVEAVEAAEPQGVYSHGAITPWRVMLKPDGQAEIIGYALPQVEILKFLENPKLIPREDSFRYCPPERLEGTREDLSADLFCLSLVAFELMTGRPVYDGLVNDIRTQAARGEGRRRLFRFKDVLPDAVRDLLTVALRARPEDRFESGDAFLEGVRMVLGGPDAEGPSLYEVMERIQGYERRPGAGLEPGKTAALSPDQIKDLLGDEDVGDILQQRDARRAAKKGGQSERKAWSPAAPRRSAAAPRAAGPRASASAQALPRAVPAAPEPAPPRAAPDPATPDPLARSSAGRWSRPDPGRRGRRPQAAAGSAPPPAEEPRSPALDPGAAAGVSSASAEDLLARLRASRSASSPERSSGGRRGRRSTSEVINKILSSGGGESARPQPPRREPPSATPPSPALSPVPAVQPELGGTPLGHQETRVLARKSREEALAAEDAAARGEEGPQRPPASGRPGGRGPAPRASGSAPFGAPFGAAAGADLPGPPGPRAVSPPVASPPPAAISSPPAASPLRPPDAIRGAGGGKGQLMRILRGPGGTALKTRLPANATMAEAVVILTGSVLPIRSDLGGRIVLNYRMGPPEGPAPGNTRVSHFPEGSGLVLHPVELRYRWASVVIEGARPASFRAPLASTVTVASVVDYICQSHDLPAGIWVLHDGSGEALSPFLLVEELDLSRPLVLKQ